MEMPNKKIQIFAAIAIGALGLYIILYRPLTINIEKARIQHRSVEDKLSNAEHVIALATKIKIERTLPFEPEDLLAIEEIVKHGESRKIEFISIAPKKAEKKGPKPIKTWPIQVEIESTYEDLGVFLKSFDELRQSLVKVKSITIAPSQDENPYLLHTDLVLDVNFYLSQKDKMPTEFVSPQRTLERTDFSLWGKNPFSQPIKKAMVVEKEKPPPRPHPSAPAPPPAPPPSVVELKLTMVFLKEDRRRAIINGSILGVGDQIAGNRVVAIQSTKVLLNDGTKDFSLDLGQ